MGSSEQAEVSVVATVPIKLPALGAAIVLTSCSAPSLSPDTAAAHTDSAPPAVSAADDTVGVKWALADSFDVLSGGRCVGRSGFAGMGDGAHVLLRGNSTGWDVEGRAAATVEHRAPLLSHGKPLIDDDNAYCVIQVVFAPAMPDPDGYSLKFAGADHWQNLGTPDRTRFNRRDRAGYGNYRRESQLCPSLLDPPDKNC